MNLCLNSRWKVQTRVLHWEGQAILWGTKKSKRGGRTLILTLALRKTVINNMHNSSPYLVVENGCFIVFFVWLLSQTSSNEILLALKCIIIGFTHFRPSRRPRKPLSALREPCPCTRLLVRWSTWLNRASLQSRRWIQPGKRCWIMLPQRYADLLSSISYQVVSSS